MTRPGMLALLLLLAGCNSTPPVPAPSEIEVVVDNDAPNIELLVGAFNMDDELKKADVSLLLIWADGRESYLLDHWQLSDWALVGGRDTPGTYISVTAKVARMPESVVIVDHLRNRRRAYGLIEGTERPVVAFVLGPKKIGLIAINGNGDRASEEPE